jgi:large subunit ribosomal protein L24
MSQIKHLRKGDEVVVRTGKDRGKRGEIIKVLSDEGRVVVDGVNVVKKHQRQQSQDQPGGILEMEAPIDVSNVQLICPHTGEPTRVGREYDEEREQWVRVSKESGDVID